MYVVWRERKIVISCEGQISNSCTVRVVVRGGNDSLPLSVADRHLSTEMIFLFALQHFQVVTTYGYFGCLVFRLMVLSAIVFRDNEAVCKNGFYVWWE